MCRSTSVGPEATPTTPQIRRRIGRARPGRHLVLRHPGRDGIATDDPHRANRVHVRCRSCRRRRRRQTVAAGRQRQFISLEYGLAAKWLELLKEFAPRTARAAVLRDLAITAGIGQFAAIQTAAPSLGTEAIPVNVWGVALSHERSDIAGAEGFHSLEGNMCGTAMRGADALPGSKATSRAKGSHRNLGG
jgi:hypothetical protein